MEGARSIFSQCQEMLWRGVTLVPPKSVLRIEGVDLVHDPVARHFGDDARGGNGKAEFVARHNRSMGGGKVGHRETVDQNVLGRCGQGVDRLAHGSMCGPEDVDRVDGDHILNRYSPMHMRGTGHLHEQLRPELGRKLLGIIQATEAPMLQENDRRGNNRPGERSTPRFINTGNKKNAPLLESALVPE